MGKMMIGSTKTHIQNLERTNVDFLESANATGPFGYVKTYKKLRIDTKNSYFDGENFALGVGTFIYQKKLDTDALRMILRDADPKGEIRNRILGSFCILIHKDNRTMVFVDGASTYDFYYYLDEITGSLIATNSYFHVAQCMNHPDVDQNGFLGALFLNNILATTAFSAIKRMTGTVMLVHDGNKWTEQPINLRPALNWRNLSSEILELYDGVAPLFDKSGVCLTGGQDSRLSLTLMLKLGFRPTLCYGTGDSNHTTTKLEDRKVVGLIAESQNLPVYDMDWTDSDGAERDRYLQKYGESIQVYNFNKHVFRELEERLNVSLLVWGYFGEVFRSIESIVTYPKQNYTLDEYIDELFVGSSVAQIVHDYVAYRGQIRKNYLEVCRRRGLNPNQLSKQSFQILNTYYRQRADVLMNHLSNMFFYSLPFLADISITSAVEEVPYEQRCGSRFLMKVMGDFSPEIRDIPYFSHIKPQRYDQKTGELRETRIYTKVKDKIRTHIHSPLLMKVARYCYYIIRGDQKGLREVKRNYQNKDNYYKDLSSYPYYSGIDIQKMVDLLDIVWLSSAELLGYTVSEAQKGIPNK